MIPNAKVAVVDVGYNSLKMVKYKVEPDGSARAYGQIAVMAKLGEGLEQTGFLGKEPVARTIDAIRICRESAGLDGIKHVLLVGTSPVREAANGEEFLKRVQDEVGLKMRVLTGNEEALYSFLGAARSVGAPTALFFDLGGGSLELSYAEKFKVKRILSLPLGALKLTSAFGGRNGNFSRKDRAKMTKRILQLLPSRRELGLDPDASLIGTGGTVRAIARFEQELVGYPLNKVHNYRVEMDSVAEICREIFRLKRDELAKIDAVGEERAETIAAGALVVRLLMKKLGFRWLTVSTHGLRDGVLTEFLARGEKTMGGIAQKEDLEVLASPSEVGLKFEAMHELLECLVRNGILEERQRGLLVRALVKGRSPDCREADPEALFGIAMSEDLPLAHEDQLLMALTLVRARKSRAANWLLEQYGSLLPKEDAKAVRKMGVCLRLMEVLDRSGISFRTSYSGGLRISVKDAEGAPLELLVMTAQGLTAAIRRPVSIFVSEKEKERKISPFRLGG